MKEYTNEIDRILDYYINQENWQDSEELKNTIGEFEAFFNKLVKNKVTSWECANNLSLGICNICYASYKDAFRKGIAIGTGIRKACLDIKMKI